MSMKKLLIIAAMFSSQALADCNTVEQLARAMMKARQAGMPASEVVQVIEAQNEPESTKKAMKSLLVEAYKLPRFNGEKFQENAINDFANDWYVMCLAGETSKA